MAHDALALLDRLGVARAHVFGLSLGGMVAQWLAADAPERLDRLVLASTLPRPGAASPRGLVPGAQMARCLIRPGVAAELCLVRRVLSPEFRAREPARVRAIERIVRRVPARRSNLLRLVLAAARHDIGARLSACTVPTLLLFGALDRLTSGRTHAELRHDAPLAELDVLPGAGHDLPLERPAQTAARVLAFLANDVAILDA
jgi:pimeloyl-ACP methyl ester carboxylesterase